MHLFIQISNSFQKTDFKMEKSTELGCLKVEDRMEKDRANILRWM